MSLIGMDHDSRVAFNVVSQEHDISCSSSNTSSSSSSSNCSGGVNDEGMIDLMSLKCWHIFKF